MASSPTPEMTDSQAERAMDEQDDDVEDAAKTPPKDDDDTPPAWLDKAAAMLNKSAGPSANNPPAAAPGAVAAALLPIRSASSQLVEQMSGVGVSPAPAAADAGASVPAGPASSAAAPAVGATSAEAIKSDSESEEEDDRTDEQKAKDKLAEDIAAEIARVEAAGFTFSKATKWAAASAYLDAKALFDEEGLDITDCANEKKKISDAAVRAKIAELRAAEEEYRAAGQLVPAAGESQFIIGSDGEDEEEEEEEEEESGDEDWSGYTIAQLTVELGQITAELALKKELAALGPVNSVLKKWNQVLKDQKKTMPIEEYRGLKSEITVMKDYFTTDIRQQGFNPKQYQMLSEMAAAEVEKAKLPGEIKVATKKVKGLEAAVEDIILKNEQEKSMNHMSKVKKRAATLAMASTDTPKKRKKRE